MSDNVGYFDVDEEDLTPNLSQYKYQHLNNYNDDEFDLIKKTGA